MSRLYPNGMVYDKWNDFVGLLFNLVMNKAIELKLQRIDHLRRPAHCTVFGQCLWHPDGVSEERHAQYALKLVPFLWRKDGKTKAPATRPEKWNASGRQHIGKNMA